jgi:hypothetical protein
MFLYRTEKFENKITDEHTQPQILEILQARFG